MKYILVNGGELFNKGAQSMVFVTMDEARKRFPDKTPLLLSNKDAARSSGEKGMYNFEICQNYLNILLFGRLYCIIKKIERDEQKRAKEVLRNTEMMLDISGYALGSNWGLKRSLLYLNRIAIAKKFGAKVYILPQSIGPFNYGKFWNCFMKYKITKILKSVDHIFARERADFDLLTQKCKLENVSLVSDLVLSKKDDIDINNIFKVAPVSNVCCTIEKNSVAIIPNIKNCKYRKKDVLLKFYRDAIALLVEKGKNVYIMSHSSEDIELCIDIKKMFGGVEEVKLIKGECNCLEYSIIISRFDFAIASRYHSVVHAYRKSIPCMVVGWANKYFELGEMFNQGDFVFNIIDDLDFAAMLNCINYLLENHREESKSIHHTLSVICFHSVFDQII